MNHNSLSKINFVGFLISLLFTIAPCATPASCPNRILVAATGDIMVHHQQQLDAHRSQEKFLSLWKPVAPFIRAVDIAYGNLESPVAMGVDANGRDHGDIGFQYDLKIYSGTNMVFNYHPQVLTDLRQVGFDVLSTANNHAMDRKSIGINRTLNELIRGNWSFTGTRFSNGVGSWGTSTQVKNKKLFWLACAEHLNGNPDPFKQVLNCFQDQKAIEDFVLEAQRSHDAVFLLPHWGDEYSEVPNARQKAWAQRMANLKVTAIIGNHPHVLQPLEKIQETWVAYSLGNFSAWQKGTERKTSAILYFELKENADFKLHSQLNATDSSFEISPNNPSDRKLMVSSIKALPIFRIGQIMYPYSNNMPLDSLRYVQKHLGRNRIVHGDDFQNLILSCEE